MKLTLGPADRTLLRFPAAFVGACGVAVFSVSLFVSGCAPSSTPVPTNASAPFATTELSAADIKTMPRVGKAHRESAENANDASDDSPSDGSDNALDAPDRVSGGSDGGDGGDMGSKSAERRKDARRPGGGFSGYK